MKKILLALAIISFLVNAYSQCIITNVASGITGSTLWEDTGIYATNGEVITINANGAWSYYNGASSSATPPDDFWYDDDDGFNLADGVDGTDGSDAFFGNNIHGSLLAYVGADPEQGQWQTYFFPQITNYWEIGSSARFISVTNGELWLGLNDDAVSGSPSDNAGSLMAQIFLNGATNDLTTNYAPILYNGYFSGNTYSFYVTNGPPDSFWAVYDSCDQTNWLFIGSLALSGLGTGYFSNVAGVPCRYYKLDNGICHSKPYGFELVSVQFSEPPNPSQTWPAAIPISCLWNLVPGETNYDGDTPIYLDGGYDEETVSAPPLYNGSGFLTGIDLNVLASTPYSYDPPVDYYSGSDANPLINSHLITAGGSDLQLGFFFPYVSGFPSEFPPYGEAKRYDLYLYSYYPYEYSTTFTLTNYIGHYSSSVSVSDWSPLTPSTGSFPVDTFIEGNQYVVFRGLAPGNWVVNVHGTVPTVNGFQVIAY